ASIAPTSGTGTALRSMTRRSRGSLSAPPSASLCRWVSSTVSVSVPPLRRITAVVEAARSERIVTAPSPPLPSSVTGNAGPAVAVDPVGPFAAVHHVVAQAAGDAVPAAVTGSSVIAVVAFQPVLPAAAGEDVVALAALEADVAGRAGDNRVVEERAEHAVVA